jgi:hypothetical protein
MKKLVEEGLAKVFTSSNISKAASDVAQFIILAKGLVDPAVQNIPHADWRLCWVASERSPLCLKTLFSR